MSPEPNVLSIKIYPEKGAQGELMASAELKAGEGIVGDYRDDISLLTKNAQLFARQNKGGLCFGRFKENIVIDASLQDCISSNTGWRDLMPDTGRRLTLGLRFFCRLKPLYIKNYPNGV